MELTFKTDINDVDVYGLEEYLKLPKTIDVDVSKSPATVDFTLTPYIKNWGIDSIQFHPRRITYTLEWETAPDFFTDEERAALVATGATEMMKNTFEGKIEIDSKEDWEVKEDIEFKEDGGFQITTVEFDFKKKIITLT